MHFIVHPNIVFNMAGMDSKLSGIIELFRLSTNSFLAFSTYFLRCKFSVRPSNSTLFWFPKSNIKSVFTQWRHTALASYHTAITMK